MRLTIRLVLPLSAALLSAALLSAPLSAQTSADKQLKQMNNRLSAIESQMRAVQREVFPGGDKRFFKPEIGPTTPETGPAAPPAEQAVGSSSLLVEFGQRLSDMESQQRQLTGQIEEIQHRLRQLEGRLQSVDADTPADSEDKPVQAATDSPEDAYRQAYALYTEQQYAAAQIALEKFVADYPKHARTADAQFWAGRSLQEQGRTADAAKTFLKGYQDHPESERAHNSLLWLSRMLIELNQPGAACQSLDQLKTSYPQRLTGQFAADVKAARSKARCDS